MSDVTYYMSVTSSQNGALGIFHLYGTEPTLRKVTDFMVGGKTALGSPSCLVPGELRYGWLRGVGGDIVDEVMLACPASEMRVLMTHGGKTIREAVEGYLDHSECACIEMDCPETDRFTDALLDRILSSCSTQGQVAAVLEARLAGTGIPGNHDTLITHRVVLSGAPNAGKSSVLNALSGYRRAFVHAEAGATRDMVEELVDLAGYAVLLGDLPGFSRQDEGLSRQAWLRAKTILGLTESVWFVCDSSLPWQGETEAAALAVADAITDNAACRIVVVLNKADLPPGFTDQPWRDFFGVVPSVRISALPGGDARERLEEIAVRLWS